MFRSKHIDKTWRDVPSPQMDRGRKIHTAFEEGIKYDIPLTAHFEQALRPFEPVRQWLVEEKAIPEYKTGVTRDFKATEFFRGPNLWVRAAFDVVVNDGEKVLIVDWKTGRYKPEHQEDAVLYGAIAERIWSLPVTVQYQYVDQPERSFGTAVTGGYNLLSMWRDRFDAADRMIASDRMSPTPGMQCKWCGNMSCPENRNEKLK